MTHRNYFRKMKRKVPLLSLFVCRRRGLALRLAALLTAAAALHAARWLAARAARALALPPPGRALDHYAVNRDLKRYLDDISVLIEPSSTACSRGQRLPVLALVTSVPQRVAQRQAIRDTWGKHLPTYFALGLDGPSAEDLEVDIYIEAKRYGDMIVFQFQDHYQNLTLKSALMMQWAATRCRTHLQEMMLLKTDDDVLVNPWILGRMVQHNSGKDLVGYRKMNSYLHRDEYSKWHVPRWLYRQDLVPEYLSGTGYLVKGSRLKEILRAAFETPVINLEDIYFTYIVAKVKLNLALTHDHRLSPYKPWLPLECMYWGLATIHSLTSDEILDSWPRIEGLGKEYENGNEKCRYFVDNIWTELYLY